MTETLDLDALRALTDAATPGPWDPLFGGEDGKTGPASWWMTYPDPTEYDDRFDWPQIQADAAFIAAARTAVPALIAEVARLRAVVASVEEAPAPTPTKEHDHGPWCVMDCPVKQAARREPTPTEEATP